MTSRISINRLLRPDLAPTPSPVGTLVLLHHRGRGRRPGGHGGGGLGIRVVDADTVEFTLDAPRSDVPQPARDVLRVHRAQGGGRARLHRVRGDLVGSGPFYLDSYVPGQGATLRRNPHYWRSGYPLVDAIDLRVNVSPQNQFLGAQSNQLDLMGDPLAAADRITAEGDPSIGDRLVSSTITATSWINMDTSGPDSPFADPWCGRQ